MAIPTDGDMCVISGFLKTFFFETFDICYRSVYSIILGSVCVIVHYSGTLKCPREGLSSQASFNPIASRHFLGYHNERSISSTLSFPNSVISKFCHFPILSFPNAFSPSSVECIDSVRANRHLYFLS